MKLSYDHKLKIAGIGLVPWTRLGPENWLDNYAIASLYGWDIPENQSSVKVHALVQGNNISLMPPKLNTPSLLSSEAFCKLLDSELKDYSLLTYRPVNIPDHLKDRKFLMTDTKYTHLFENKISCRQRFSSIVKFPAYAIYKTSNLKRDEVYFKDLLQGRKKVVVQDELLSGSKGTYVVSTYSDYLTALDNLPPDRSVVVSDFIESARERTIQVCVTKHGIFTGPLQRQIVRHPALVNESGKADKFCGGSIKESDQGSGTHEVIKKIAMAVGRGLQAEGYRGIFGLDFLMDSTDNIYMLEINARVTGLTPLINAMYIGDNGIPFYLLHLLELGGYNYRIEDDTTHFYGDGTLLILHSLEDKPMRLRHLSRSGTYTVEDGELRAVNRSIELSKLGEGEFVLQHYIPRDLVVKPGRRIAVILIKDQTMDKNSDMLYYNTLNIIAKVREAMVLEEV